MTTDLRACPFCGGEGETDFHDHNGHTFVRCSDCGAQAASATWQVRALDAQAGLVCVGWEWLDTRDEMGWMRLNMSPESTPPLSPEIKYRRIYAGPVEGGGT